MYLKTIFLTVIISITPAAFAQESYCVTHAQCQNLTDESTACFLVETEDISDKGTKTCEVKCHRVYVGSYCKFEEGKSYGVCAEEDYKQAKVSKKNDCSNAIPAKILEEVFVL
ncbi:MAG: hypothetical protein BM556_09240 [Bacteriovorax sp. MedPE-SWde]|nr:MAG: hypothetical protein BM556_09240 [Bacteriovorax sp. MedPE-SWde]